MRGSSTAQTTTDYATYTGRTSITVLGFSDNLDMYQRRLSTRPHHSFSVYLRDMVHAICQRRLASQNGKHNLLMDADERSTTSKNST